MPHRMCVLIFKRWCLSSLFKLQFLLLIFSAPFYILQTKRAMFQVWTNHGGLLIKIQKFIALRKWVKERRGERAREMKNRLFTTCYLVISSQIRKAKMHSRRSELAQTELKVKEGLENSEAGSWKGEAGPQKAPSINFLSKPIYFTQFFKSRLYPLFHSPLPHLLWFM